MESTETMAQFLAPTPLCDCDSAGIKDKAKDLAGTAKDPSEAALSVFYFVRDKITFGLYFPDAKASKTLDHGSGFCMTKTNPNGPLAGGWHPFPMPSGATAQRSEPGISPRLLLKPHARPNRAPLV